MTKIASDLENVPRREEREKERGFKRAICNTRIHSSDFINNVTDETRLLFSNFRTFSVAPTRYD